MNPLPSQAFHRFNSVLQGLKILSSFHFQSQNTVHRWVDGAEIKKAIYLLQQFSDESIPQEKIQAVIQEARRDLSAKQTGAKISELLNELEQKFKVLVETENTHLNSLWKLQRSGATGTIIPAFPEKAPRLQTPEWAKKIQLEFTTGIYPIELSNTGSSFLALSPAGITSIKDPKVGQDKPNVILFYENGRFWMRPLEGAEITIRRHRLARTLKPTAPWLLQEGDQITIGRRSFKVRLPQEPAIDSDASKFTEVQNAFLRLRQQYIEGWMILDDTKAIDLFAGFAEMVRGTRDSSQLLQTVLKASLPTIPLFFAERVSAYLAGAAGILPKAFGLEAKGLEIRATIQEREDQKKAPALRAENQRLKQDLEEANEELGEIREQAIKDAIEIDRLAEIAATRIDGREVTWVIDTDRQSLEERAQDAERRAGDAESQLVEQKGLQADITRLENAERELRENLQRETREKDAAQTRAQQEDLRRSTEELKTVALHMRIATFQSERDKDIAQLKESVKSWREKALRGEDRTRRILPPPQAQYEPIESARRFNLERFYPDKKTGMTVILGRPEIPGPNISKQHLMLEFYDSHWGVIDMGSLVGTGTLLNGEPIQSKEINSDTSHYFPGDECVLEEGFVITLGGIHLQFHQGDDGLVDQLVEVRSITPPEELALHQHRSSLIKLYGEGPALATMSEAFRYLWKHFPGFEEKLNPTLLAEADTLLMRKQIVESAENFLNELEEPQRSLVFKPETLKNLNIIKETQQLFIPAPEEDMLQDQTLLGPKLMKLFGEANKEKVSQYFADLYRYFMTLTLGGVDGHAFTPEILEELDDRALQSHLEMKIYPLLDYDKNPQGWHRAHFQILQKLRETIDQILKLKEENQTLKIKTSVQTPDPEKELNEKMAWVERNREIDGCRNGPVRQPREDLSVTKIKYWDRVRYLGPWTFGKKYSLDRKNGSFSIANGQINADHLKRHTDTFLDYVKWKDVWWLRDKPSPRDHYALAKGLEIPKTTTEYDPGKDVYLRDGDVITFGDEIGEDNFLFRFGKNGEPDELVEIIPANQATIAEPSDTFGYQVVTDPLKSDSMVSQIPALNILYDNNPHFERIARAFASLRDNYPDVKDILSAIQLLEAKGLTRRGELVAKARERLTEKHGGSLPDSVDEDLKFIEQTSQSFHAAPVDVVERVDAEFGETLMNSAHSKAPILAQHFATLFFYFPEMSSEINGDPIFTPKFVFNGISQEQLEAHLRKNVYTFLHPSRWPKAHHQICQVAQGIIQDILSIRLELAHATTGNAKAEQPIEMDAELLIDHPEAGTETDVLGNHLPLVVIASEAPKWLTSYTIEDNPGVAVPHEVTPVDEIVEIQMEPEVEILEASADTPAPAIRRQVILSELGSPPLDLDDKVSPHALTKGAIPYTREEIEKRVREQLQKSHTLRKKTIGEEKIRNIINLAITKLNHKFSKGDRKPLFIPEDTVDEIILEIRNKFIFKVE